MKITLIVLGVFIISATLSLFFYVRSTRELSQKSKDKVIKTEAENLTSGFGFMTETYGEKMMEKFKANPETIDSYLNSFSNKKQTASMQETNVLLKEQAGKATLGVNYFFVLLKAIPPAVPEPIILAASDDKLIFADVPDNIREAFDNEDNYAELENGIPEWGIKGEQLFVFKKVEFDVTKGMDLYSCGIKPLGEDLTEINDYFNEATRKINILMAVIIAASLVVLVITTYFILSRMIRKDITEPIEELSGAAEKVMDGDLDVEVPIKKGEEFATLKQAFNEMIRSIRDVINRSSE